MAEPIGQQLGNYKLTQLVGHGGFAEVYLGEHVYLRTFAAVKVLQTRLSGPEDIESFLTEARTIARLSHPHIIRVLNFGIDKETPFLVMDYASNGTLRQRHSRGSQLPLATILPYVKQVADALQYAHDEKLIHRDIKPENMLIDRRNDILLSDFGIALVAQSSHYQSTQDVIGTVAYMSPEQIQGKPRPASDQYSLGIVIYEWLTGDRPFKGSFTELCTQHMFATPPPLHEKVSTISPAVEQVVMIALAKEPKQRFGSVQAFANALEQASKKTEDKPVQPQSYSLPPTIPSSSVPPTQYVPPATPSLPPTQYAPPPPPFDNQLLPENSPSYRNTPLAQTVQNQSNARQNEAKVRVWSLGRRQILAMLVATLIYGILEFAVGKLYVTSSNNGTNFNSSFFVNIGNIPYFPSLGQILFNILFSIPFFFGTEFGPWVGLISVVVGGLLGDYLSGYLTLITFQASWYIYAGSTLLGFFPGLALLITHGKYTTISAIRVALLMSALGILITSVIWTVGDVQEFHLNFFPDFSAITLSNIAGLIILPVFLVIYNRMAPRENKSAI